MKILLGLILTTILCRTEVQSQQLATWKYRTLSSGWVVGINPLNPNSVYTQNGARVLLVSYDRGTTWQARGTLPVGLIRQILVHPLDTTLILCAAFTGGIQRSTDYGLSWTSLLPSFGIDGESIAINPVHPDTLYAGDFFTGNVYLSANRGETWTQVGTVGGSICAFIVRPDSTNILYAGAGSGRISKTTDRGLTWRVVKPEGSEEIPKIVINDLAPLVAYGAGYEGPDSTTGVWKTTNGGEQWFRTSLVARSIWALDIDQNNPSTLYAGTFGETDATVFVTTDAGNTWTSHGRGIPPSSSAWNLKVHPLDGNVVWLAEGGQPPGIYQYITSNTIVRGVVVESATGDTVRNGWIVNTASHDSVDLASSGGRFAFGYFPGDSSTTPVFRVTAYPYYITDISIGFIQDSTVAHTVLLQQLPTATIAGTVHDSLTLQPVHALVTLVGSTISGAFVLNDTTDLSGTFTFVNRYITHPPVVRYDRIEIDPVIPHPHHTLPSFTLTEGGVAFPTLLPNADILLVGGDSIRYADYFTTTLDSIGISWNLWSSPDPAPLSGVSRFRKNAVVFYTGNRNTPFTPGEVDSLMACIALGGNLFITGQNISEYNDTTALLRDVIGVQFGGTPGTFAGISGVSGDLFSGVNFGTSGAGGANNQTSRDRLIPIGSGTIATLQYSIPGGTAGVRRDITPGKIVFLGFGFEGINSTSARRAVMQRIIGYFDGSITLGVDGDIGLPPYEFRLNQNYPNPFNTSTTIRYAIEYDVNVTLSIYNVLGQIMMTLVDNEHKPRGTYDVSFTMPDFPTGVYLYRIKAGSFTEVRKLTVLK